MTVRTMVQPVPDTMQRQTRHQEPPADPQPEQRQRDKEGASGHLAESGAMTQEHRFFDCAPDCS